MPPSPTLRCSPGRQLPGKKYRRGHNINYGILFRHKDEDLALFSEMQEKERDSFLLQSSDDLEDAFSTKLKHFSKFTIPGQGESSRFLSAEEDKNDYDWLLTSPGTSLFPSLDDVPPSTNVVRRGRPQSQISLSRSSTMEKSRRGSKGSASPNRLSTSPRADNMQQIKGRPSSARHASPVSGRRSATPVRRTSSTPRRPSGHVSRSPTPTSRRISTGSTTKASPAVKGTSPVSSSRGNSPSPKIKVWQTNIPGFSLDVPPNLRTSMGDRPSSYVRGSSPASTNGRDAASTRSKQSVFPSASRSVSSSHSHERDRFSSHSKGSLASSGDDDLPSLQSIPVGGSKHVVSKRSSLSPNSRTSRSSKLLSPGSGPREPFESALRQMDHPKSHHTMSKPLASSLPSTCIYPGKGGSSYHNIMLRHSTVTVGSNSSSSLLNGFMSYTKGSGPIPVFQFEVENLAYPDKHGENATFGMVELSSEVSRHESHESSFSDQRRDMDEGDAVEYESSVNKEVNHQIFDVENCFRVEEDLLEGVSLKTMEVCGRCSSHYHASEATRSELNICPDCWEEHDFVATDSSGTRALDESSLKQSQEMIDENKSYVENIPVTHMLESLLVAMAETEIVEKRENIEQRDIFNETDQYQLHESSITRTSEELDEEMPNQQDGTQSYTGCEPLDVGTKDTQLQVFCKHHEVEIGSSEIGDVPLLRKRLVSMKLPNIQAYNSSCFTRSYEGLSYSRKRSISLISSTETTSAFSSWGYGSSIIKGSQTRQRSGSTLDMETHRYDTNSKFLSTMSSSSGMSGHVLQALNLMPEDSIKVCAAQMTCTHDENHQESYSELQDLGCKDTNVMNAGFSENVGLIVISTNAVGALAEHNPVIIDYGLSKSGDDVANIVTTKVKTRESPTHVRSTSELGASLVTDDCSLYDQSSLQEKYGNDSPRHCSSPATASKMELQSCEPEVPSLGFREEILEPECSLNAMDDYSEKSMVHASVDYHSSLAPVIEISDESTILVECEGRKEPKSLTLEEATDSILFCSFIVHDLVYQAATLAVDKAKDVPAEEEMLHPKVTVLEKLNANRSSHAHGGGTKVKKQSSKSAKASRKQTETEEKIEVRIENAGETVIIGNIGVPPSRRENFKPPPKLESKCNCSIM